MSFLFDAAKRRATELGLTVVSVCHASLPDGLPCRDHYGNYLTARTVYIGEPGTIEKDCTYGRSVFPIHQTVEPGVDSCLFDVWEALHTIKKYSSCETYLESVAPYVSGPIQLEQARSHWFDRKSVADRARRCLPAELMAWLMNLR